jgi:hypothetical protein
MKKVFSGEEFLKALSDGSLEGLVPGLGLTGLVRPSPDEPKALQFSPQLLPCGVWVTLPTSMIERVEWLGKWPCRERAYDPDEAARRPGGGRLRRTPPPPPHPLLPRASFGIPGGDGGASARGPRMAVRRCDWERRPPARGVVLSRCCTSPVSSRPSPIPTTDPFRVRLAMTKTYSAKEFLTALSEGDLKAAIVRTGMVKRAEDDDQAVLFAEGTNCAGWTKIPAAMIEKVEWLGKVPCHDHTHDFVNLHLKEPTSPDASVFAALLQTTAAFEMVDEGTGLEASFALPMALPSHPMSPITAGFALPTTATGLASA